ncbi:hypothetical protein FRACYDRAFT_271788 [Fragilariopsis cylindrus CCMP1102]|uniref:Uncharacterized protein n=1 Tax=Fragilariopsis cylindrus CCMP1102 TaxID=635003 RepID=A0A1E7EQG7_9STRA|nr:hypothetical protein FRACYDRAFT_271788 [Fragilariopsis cylindrus CCMP1102]|eukprot:OEU08198.1 hypothetical protein FRACYDRAFT_271788 [Fragilariopsis cylindrus CCMP1102]
MTAVTSSSSRNDDNDEQDQQQLQKYDNEDEVLIEVPRRTRTYDEPLVIDTKDPLLLLEDVHIYTYTQTQKNQQEQLLDISEEQANETGKKNKKAKTKRKDRRWSKRLNRKMNSFQQQEHNSMNSNNIIIEVEESSLVFDYGVVEQSHDCDENNNTGFEVHVTQK